MNNFSINFTNPWLLFALIPAIGVALILFFRVERKYRYTRTRVCSVVLYCVAMLLAILVLAGMTFSYTESNDRNEVVFLVDVSDTEEEAKDSRDEFLQTALSYGSYDNFKIGVVTFGFDQKYAVEMTYDVAGIYSNYLTAELPDTSATDIAAALLYTKDLFSNPETGKIVLITDAKETDESALSAIRTLTASGITVDVAYTQPDSENEDDEVQITQVTLPDYHVYTDEECNISVTLQSNVEAVVTITLLDNGASDASVKTLLAAGTKTFTFTHVFKEQGLHELTFDIEFEDSAADTIGQNNKFTSYYYIEVFNKVLVIESFSEQSTELQTLLTDSDYDVTVVNVSGDEVPTTVDGLRQYDQVILNNVSHTELASRTDCKDESGNDVTLEDILYTYVYEYGGGLLTTGGTEADGVTAHAYSRSDMYGSTLQSMLPVEVLKYTPPVGVMVIVDRSSSMDTAIDGVSKYEWALTAAQSCFNALLRDSSGNYFGLMTLDTDYDVILNPVPVSTQQSKISAIIEQMKEDGAHGGTIYTSALDRAGRALKELDVSMRHIIIITDAEPNDDPKQYLPIVQNYYEENGITLSFIGIGVSEGNTTVEALVEAGGGEYYAVTNAENLEISIINDLGSMTVEEVADEEFSPRATDSYSALLKGVNRKTAEEGNIKELNLTLGGYFGVRSRTGATVVLENENGIPIYAQWTYGNGTVGSFMCDVYGERSGDLMTNDNGKQFLLNVVANLMPIESVRPNEVEAKLTSENYINKLSVFSSLEEGEKITGDITFSVDGTEYTVPLDGTGEENEYCYITVPLTSPDYSKCEFIAKANCVYTISLQKCGADGSVVSETTLFKSFAYSAEYDVNETEEDLNAQSEFAASLADRGNGELYTGDELLDPIAVFEDFVTQLERTIDPRIALAIIIMVLFLLNIAVRKFKFKWIHEIIRERRANKK